MRKLLVLLVALVTVAAFAAVSISGSASAELKVEFDTTTATPTITSGGSVGLVLSGNIGQRTGFYVTFSAFSVSNARVYEYLYMTDPLKIRYWLGFISRGSAYVTNRTGAFALDFAMDLGDLKDNLVAYVYFPASATPTIIDVDVYNKLTFAFVTLTAFAKGLISAGTGSFPLLGLDTTINLAQALNIQGATLSGYANLGINPNNTGFNMLQNYKFGVNFGIDNFTGGLWFEGPKTLGASVSTTILSPVTIGGSVTLPVDMANFSDVILSAYVSWTSELLSHKISLDFKQPKATVAWTVSVSF